MAKLWLWLPLLTTLSSSIFKQKSSESTPSPSSQWEMLYTPRAKQELRSSPTGVPPAGSIQGLWVWMTFLCLLLPSMSGLQL